MKIFHSILFICFMVCALAQKRAPVNSNPEYYVDSVRVNSIQLFDHQKIEKVNVVKGKDSMAPNSKVFISIKKSAVLKWVTTKDIITKYQLADSFACIFMVNNNIIKDPDIFRIDEYFITGIDVMKADELENLPNNIPNLELLKLFTCSKENLIKQKIVRIRSRRTN
ncbi:MAG: hypothetical protein IPP72_14680 [Chitinophagaceae bacterium]|nr:hypothetical protein [Chitinophagaceae bacterium]